MEKLSIKAVLLSATLLVPIGITAACADEAGKIAPFSQDIDSNSTTQSPSGSPSAATAFNRRWTSESKDFFVGTDGVVAADYKSESDIRINNHIGNGMSAFMSTGSPANITNSDTLYQSKVTLLGNLLFNKKAMHLPNAAPPR